MPFSCGHDWVLDFTPRQDSACAFNGRVARAICLAKSYPEAITTGTYHRVTIQAPFTPSPRPARWIRTIPCSVPRKAHDKRRLPVYSETEPKVTLASLYYCLPRVSRVPPRRLILVMPTSRPLPIAIDFKLPFSTSSAQAGTDARRLHA